MVTYHHLWVGYYFLFQVEANWHPFLIGQQLADQFLCMVDTCNRLGGTGLGLTEEVEDVGDLHRGELLAVLAIPFASIFLAISRLRWDMPSSMPSAMPSALPFSIPSSIPFWYLSSRRYRSFMASKPRTAIVSIPTSEDAKTIAVLTS